MRALLYILLLFTTFPAWAQLRLNASIISPPFLETVNIGRFPTQFYTNTTKNSLSPGIELDNLFAREKNGLKLHFSIGAYYIAQSFTGTYHDTSTLVYNGYPYLQTNTMVSQINTKLINIPIMARGSFKISELIENNRVGFELGIVTSVFLNYHLSETAGTSFDSAGYYIPSTSPPVTAQGNLISGSGGKVTFKAVGGIFVYVNRFFLSGRFDIASLSNLYAKKFDSNTWQVPQGFSLYQLASTQGKMKDSFVTIVVSYRITRK